MIEPIMKVFTVGLDEKPPLKEHPEPESVTVVPPPTIAVERKMKKSYKGYMLCFATLFFVLFFALILSEIAYNRARDESFLRLRWAELRHRMGMGCNECNQQRIAQSLFRQNRFDSAPFEEKEVVTAKSTTPSSPAIQPIDDVPKEGRVLDPRFEFLRQVLTKIREQAEKAGIDGTMKVSVIRIDPAEENQDNSVLDGFGEVQQIPQFGNSLEYQSSRRNDRLFGPWISDDYYNNEDNSPQVYEILANRRTELGPQMNGQMELIPVASNAMESSNGWSSSILPWAGTINQGQKTFETYQPIQQPEYIKFLNIQQWPQNNYQPQEQWPNYQPQSTPIQNSQWYNTDNQWQNQNPFWQWQGDQWQQVNPWNQWQNGIQANNHHQQQQQQLQQNTIQWPAQQAVNSIQDDNRWQASLQNNQWTIQKANPVENNQISQQPVAQQPVQWWNSDNKWNNQVVQPQQETTQASNAVPVIQQQPVVDWAQQSELPWTHVPQKSSDTSQMEQRVILTSVENKEKPVVEQIQPSALDDQAPVISNPQDVPYILEQQVPEIQQTVELPQIVPVVQQKSEDLSKKFETELEKPKTETETKSKLVEETVDEPLKTHIADLPTLELTYQKHQIIPSSESDASEEQPQKIDFPAVKFPAQPLNEAEDVSSHIFFQVDEPQPQFGEAEAFAAK